MSPSLPSPPPSYDNVPYEKLHTAATELEHDPVDSQSPKQWFDVALRQAEAARAAERRGSKPGQYVAYTRLAIAYQKCKMHPRLKDARTADPQWASRVNEFKATFELALRRATTLKEELKHAAEETPNAAPPSAPSSQTGAVDKEPGGSIADRMKALRGHGMNVGSSKRSSRDLAPASTHPAPTSAPAQAPAAAPAATSAAAFPTPAPFAHPSAATSPTDAAAGGSHAVPTTEGPSEPKDKPTHQRTPSLPAPPPIPMLSRPASSTSLSGMNGVASQSTSAASGAVSLPVAGTSPPKEPAPPVAGTSARPPLPHPPTSKPPPHQPPPLAPVQSAAGPHSAQSPNSHLHGHPLPTAPGASAMSPTSPATEDPAARVDSFEKAFPSLDELGKQFDDDEGFAAPPLPTANGKHTTLPDPPKPAPPAAAAAEDADAFPSFPSLPSVPKDLPGSTAKKNDLPPPPPAPPRIEAIQPDGDEGPKAGDKARSPPSPDMRRHDRPASTLGFTAPQNSLNFSPSVSPQDSMHDGDAKLKDPPAAASVDVPEPDQHIARVSSREPQEPHAPPDNTQTHPKLPSAPSTVPSLAALPEAMPTPHVSKPATTSAAAAATSATKAPPPAPQNNVAKVKKPDFPYTNSILPDTLRTYFLNPSAHILLLDVRPTEEFSHGYVGAQYYDRGCEINVVWIDPTVLMRPNLTSGQLEDALSLNPEAQQSAFQARNRYELVVIYDSQSKRFPVKGEAANPVSRLWDIIYEHEFAKPLPRMPTLLVGGYHGWIEFIKSRQAMHMRNMREQHHEPPPVANGHSSRPSHPPMSPTKRSQRDAAVYSPPAHYAKDITDSFNYGTPQSMTGSRHGYSASYSGGAASYMPYQASAAPSAPPSRPPMPASHSSSASISSYQQPPSNTQFPPVPAPPSREPSSTYSTSSSYTSNSTIVPPPRASVHASAMTRRQNSGDFYQTPGSRPAIDYPQPHGLVRVPQRPPAAASHGLERQDQRVRLPPRNVDHLTESGVRYWVDTKLGLTGLKNLGNTCYMNSTVQCLSATFPFARYFLDGAYKRDLNTTSNLGTKGRLARAFADLLRALWDEDWNCLSPITFRQSIISFNDLFAGSEQHDSQEFLSFVLDGLHEDLNKVKAKPSIQMTKEREAALETLPPQIASDKEWQIYRMRDDSFIVDLFQGQYMSRTTCLTCQKTSTVYDSFMWLTLDLPTTRKPVMLPELVDRWVQPEILSVEDGWVCTNCKKPRRASKALTLVRLPPVLLIQLKRFSMSPGGFWNRSDTPVIFPTNNLDLTRLVPRREPTGNENLDDPRTQIGPFKYDLYGVTNHSGTLSSGHYTAFVRSSGRWMFCEDSRISPATEHDVISRPAASYILFYKRVQAT